MSRLVSLLLIVASCRAGQSLVLTGGNSTALVDPYVSGTPSRQIEFQIHNWAVPGTPNQAIFNLAGVGVVVYIQSSGLISLTDQRMSVGPLGYALTAGANTVLRYRRDVTGGTATLEAWNADGTGYQIYTLALGTPTSPWDSWRNGGQIGDTATDTRLAFLRVSTTLDAVGARPPVTAGTADYTELKLDGNGADSSGNGHAMTWDGATYETTVDQVAHSVPKVYGTPSWTSAISMRAGASGQLDGTSSYSMADASAAVSYFWQCLSGPSVPVWSSHTTATPTVTGLVFGEYVFQLQVTDAASTVGTATLAVGAVATDSNGVVVNADPKVDAIFGPMIAFGRNPWGYMDERAATATRLRKVVYEAVGANGYSFANPSYLHNGAGTVAYIFNGLGTTGHPVTTLATGINATDTTIVVADASALDLTGLPGTPVRICLSAGGIPCSNWSAHEEVRICSAAGNTLTVCYDGRGHGDFYASGGAYTAASSWSAGTTNIGQYKITGSSTRFVTDAAVPMCPAGAPGPVGPIRYSTGQVTMTPGSTAVTGVKTVWTLANGATGARSVWLRVAATHATGTPFVFWAYVSTVNGETSITLDRAYPATADAGDFDYKLVAADSRLWGLEYPRADASPAKHWFYAKGCESETAGYAIVYSEMASVAGTAYSGKTYTYQEGLGMQSQYGYNFYGEGLAHRALHYRSGLSAALTAANIVDNNWIRAPEVTSPSGPALFYGGAGVGAITNLVLNAAAATTWNDVRPYISAGAIGSAGCSELDTRDSGYLGAFLTLGANFDPTLSGTWETGLASVLTRDQTCKQTDNSWSHGFQSSTTTPHITLATGSPTGSGTGLTAASTGCYVTASGTGSATNGSATLTGTGFTSGAMIAVTGTLGGNPYTGFYRYTGTSSPLSLSAVWPGSTDSITWMISSSTNVGVFTQTAPTAATKNWVCRLDSGTQITLQRNWDGGNASDFHPYFSNVSGFGQQPYMLGIKSHSFEWGSQSDDPTIAAGYAALKPLAADWVYTTGYDAQTQGMHYARVFGMCEPSLISPIGSTFTWISGGECGYGLDPGSSREARVLNAEVSSSLRAKYEAVPTPTIKEWGDTVYGSIWGYPAWTTGGVYSDSNYVREQITDVTLAGYKWPGFFFGMGMAHQWPAVRLGGVAAAVNRVAKIGFTLPAGADDVQFVATAPSGVQTTTTCTTSPCSVTLDARQGNHLLLNRYRAAGVVIAAGERAVTVVE